MMPVNPYDDRKVSLRRRHGKGDLDIVRALYTCRKANEALETIEYKLWHYIEEKSIFDRTHKTPIE